MTNLLPPDLIREMEERADTTLLERLARAEAETKRLRSIPPQRHRATKIEAHLEKWKSGEGDVACSRPAPSQWRATTPTNRRLRATSCNCWGSRLRIFSGSGSTRKTSVCYGKRTKSAQECTVADQQSRTGATEFYRRPGSGIYHAFEDCGIIAYKRGPHYTGKPTEVIEHDPTRRLCLKCEERQILTRDFEVL